MPGFPKPDLQYEIKVDHEVEKLRSHRATREVPKRESDYLLLATWNIANLGAKEQVREPECFDLLAEIVQWFDVVAVQEVRDDANAGIRELLTRLPTGWQTLFSEAGGNDERFGFLWDSHAVELGQLVGKATLEPSELERAGGSGFEGFSRTPYIATFHRGELALEVVSVHSFFGKTRDQADMKRRLGETRAIGWWCEERSKDPDSYTKDIVAVGDFNTPSEDDLELAQEMLGDLRRRGLHTPQYERGGAEVPVETQLGTAVRSENHYDHLLFFPRHTEADLAEVGIFDFDAVVFGDLWEDLRARHGEDEGRKLFHEFTVWAVSDHRPLWGRFRT